MNVRYIRQKMAEILYRLYSVFMLTLDERQPND